MDKSNIKYISFPSKTFLIGEYAVLEKGPAVLVNTHPRFCFSVKKGKNKNDFHPHSPAGQWLKLHPKIQCSIESFDPHNSQGGFGFSSAQFSLVYLLGEILEKDYILEKGSLPEVNLLQMWTDYRNLNFKGYRPSGADVVSQWIGKICLFSSDPFSVNSIDWPFKELDFFLLRTGVKFNTWEHLKKIDRGDFSVLSEMAKRAVFNIKRGDAENFILALDEYSSYLEKKSLVHSKTVLFLNKVRKIKSVITARGCGAMGAEVVAVFFDPKNRLKVNSALKEQYIVAGGENLTCGINIHKSKM